MKIVVENVPGIYAFVCVATGKRYIGSALRLLNRLCSHVYALRKNKHHNNYFQNAWNKHTEDGFEFIVLEYCDGRSLRKREQFWIMHYKSAEVLFGYNIAYPVKQRLPSKRMSKRHKESWANLTEEEYLERTAYSSDPKYLALRSQIMNAPEVRKALSEKALARWSDPKFHKRATRSMTKFWESEASESERETRKTTANKQWASEAHRESMSEVRAKRWKDPEYAQERKDGSKKLWANDAYRAKVTNKVKTSCNDPEYLAGLRQRTTEQWAKKRKEKRERLNDLSKRLEALRPSA